MKQIEISFPAPAEVINLNNRLHWRPKAERTALWRQAAWAVANNVRRHPSWYEPVGRCEIQVSFPTNRMGTRRDPHNWVSTVKPIIDGLVDAKLLVDDSSDYVILLDSNFHSERHHPYVHVTMRWPEWVDHAV